MFSRVWKPDETLALVFEKVLSGSLNGGCCKGTTGEPEDVVK